MVTEGEADRGLIGGTDLGGGLKGGKVGDGGAIDGEQLIPDADAAELSRGALDNAKDAQAAGRVGILGKVNADTADVELEE